MMSAKRKAAKRASRRKAAKLKKASQEPLTKISAPSKAPFKKSITRATAKKKSSKRTRIQKTAAASITAKELPKKYNPHVNFLSLPAEIRNEIYHLSLVLNVPLVLREPTPWVDFKEEIRFINGDYQKEEAVARTNFEFPKILHTCSQIRNEALPIFLDQLEVRVSARLYMTESTELPSPRCEKNQTPLSMAWLAGLGYHKAKMLRKLELRVCRCCWSTKGWAMHLREEVPRLLGKNAMIFEDLGFTKLGPRPERMTITRRTDCRGFHRAEFMPRERPVDARGTPAFVGEFANEERIWAWMSQIS